MKKEDKPKKRLRRFPGDIGSEYFALIWAVVFAWLFLGYFLS